MKPPTGHIAFAQKAFIVHDDRLLLIRKSLLDPHHPGKWEVPGGRMEYGEDPDSHLIREVHEEAGLNVVPGSPFFIWSWFVSSSPQSGAEGPLQVVAVARICTSPETKVTVEGQVDGDFLDQASWVPISELAQVDFIPNMRAVVRRFLGVHEDQC